MTLQTLNGLVALVTGGTSGLGKAVVQRLLKLGARGVVIFDSPSTSEAGKELASKAAENCLFVPTDITSESDVKNAFNIIKDKYEKLDVAINCSIFEQMKRLYNFDLNRPHDLEDFHTALKINALGTFNVARLAAGFIKSNKPDEDGYRGLIINTATTSALDGYEGQVADAASTSAIAGMTLPITRELGKFGIRCCTIVPGLFDTPQVRQLLPEKVLNFFVSEVPFPKRLGDPDEFAHLVQFIIENPMMNGAIIRIDGAMRFQ